MLVAPQSVQPLTESLTCFYAYLALLPLTDDSREAYKKAAGKGPPDLRSVLSPLPLASDSVERWFEAMEHHRRRILPDQWAANKRRELCTGHTC